jgi:hypothetical protein
MRMASGQLTASTMSGDVEICLLQPHGELGSSPGTLKDILFVLEIKINFLGTIRLGKRGIGVSLLPNEVVLTHTMDVFGYGDIVGDEYLLRTKHHGSASVVTVFGKHEITLGGVLEKSREEAVSITLFGHGYLEIHWPVNNPAGTYRGSSHSLIEPKMGALL